MQTLIDRKVSITPGSGQRFLYTMPYSEVCVHMRIAGKPMWVEMINKNLAQLYDLNHQKFSAPILYCEAGIYRGNGEFYTYLNPDVS